MCIAFFKAFEVNHFNVAPRESSALRGWFPKLAQAKLDIVLYIEPGK